MELKCPKCGGERFIAHQVLRADVIVDESNTFIEDLDGGLKANIYDWGIPYGPYTCTNCGYEFDPQ